jgi:3-oxoadipate enol-lactonase
MTSVEVHDDVSGPADAPAVVLCNSLGATLQMWDPQAAALAQRLRVVRFDARGHGRSPVPVGPYSIDDLAGDVISLLDRLDLPRAHVVGLSLGGMVAMRVASRWPERVDRLVLMCTAPALGPPSGWVERAALVRAQGAAAVAPAVTARWLTDAHRAADPELAQQVEAMIAATPAEGYAASCAAIEELDLWPDLAAIVASTLVVAGSDDPVTPPDVVERMAAAVAGSRFAVVDGAAHLANLDQPERVNSLLLAHLAPG